MDKKSQIEMVSYNINNIEVCASAARISTTQGNAFEIFEKAKNNEKNQELVKKVLDSGHKSIIEHAFFTFALKDVSAFVEQFFIEFRLASFTVKSRRYVDFSKLGYYIPTDLSGGDLKEYCEYMDILFNAYKELLECGISKEDARFLLPYSFNSNFYCTVNARELAKIIYEMKYGRGQGIPEIQNLAKQIIEQVENVFPCINFENKGYQSKKHGFQKLNINIRTDNELTFVEKNDIGIVDLINKPYNPTKILETAFSMDHKDCTLNINDILNDDRGRQLEQLSYTFSISNITLSGITHIVRHRMQSIIIPSILEIEHSKVIIPETIKNNSKALDIYKKTLEVSNNRLLNVRKNDILKRYGYYYALSGNMMDIMTTINARELMEFFKLRTCNRAQWEIRDVSTEMLKQLRNSFPELFNHFGPSCFVKGKCPEGRMTCGKTQDVIKKFKQI